MGNAYFSLLSLASLSLSCHAYLQVLGCNVNLSKQSKRALLDLISMANSSASATCHSGTDSSGAQITTTELEVGHRIQGTPLSARPRARGGGRHTPVTSRVQQAGGNLPQHQSTQRGLGHQHSTPYPIQPTRHVQQQGTAGNQTRSLGGPVHVQLRRDHTPTTQAAHQRASTGG